LLLAARKLPVVTGGQFLQCAQTDNLIHIEPVLIEPTEHSDALTHTEEVLQRRFLEENAGFLAELLTQRCSAIAHLTRGRIQNAFHDFNRRRLARAIGTEQPEADSFRYRKR